MNSHGTEVSTESRLEERAFRGRKRLPAASHGLDACSGLRVERFCRPGAVCLPTDELLLVGDSVLGGTVLARPAQALHGDARRPTADAAALGSLHAVHAHHPICHHVRLALEAVVGRPDRQLRLKPRRSATAAT